MKKRTQQSQVLVPREHCRHIFGDPLPVLRVWEPEFDYADQQLQQIAATDWRQITQGQLSSYYVLNLVWHEPLQPDLFRYLFPLCLAEWHETVLTDADDGFFAETFQRALRRAYLWQDMMSSVERLQVSCFLRETLLARMDRESDFFSPMGWLESLNNLAGITADISVVWLDWWQMDTPGRAVCALQYSAQLIYPPEHNPLWREQWYDWRLPLTDSGPWLTENVAFLRQQLTPDELVAVTQAAAYRLRAEPEWEMAARIAVDALNSREIMAIQIEVLLTAIAGED